MFSNTFIDSSTYFSSFIFLIIFQVAFSDEISICFRASCYSMKHPEEVMFWGVILIKRPYYLRSLNSDQYWKVIDSRVIPQLMDWYGSLKECVLQQNKAPCHSSKTLKQNMNDTEIKVLE